MANTGYKKCPYCGEYKVAGLGGVFGCGGIIVALIGGAFNPLFLVAGLLLAFMGMAAFQAKMCQNCKASFKSNKEYNEAMNKSKK